MPKINNVLMSLNLNGNIVRQTQIFARSFDFMKNKVNGTFSSLNKGAFRFSNTLDKALSLPMVGFGAVLAASARGTMELNIRMKQFQNQVKLADDEMESLSKKIFEISESRKVDPLGMLDAVERTVKKTGDLKFALEHLETMAIFSSASQQSGAEVGNFMVNLSRKFNVKEAEELKEVLSSVAAVAEKSSLTFGEMVSAVDAATAAYGKLGSANVNGMKNLSALAAISAAGADSADDIPLLLTSLVKDLSNTKKLAQNGISIKNKELSDVLMEIIKKSGGDEGKISRLLSTASVQAISGLTANYRQTKNFDGLKELLETSANKNRLDDIAALNAKSLSASLTMLKASVLKFTSAVLPPLIDKLAIIVEKMADWAAKLTPEQIEAVLNALKYAAYAWMGNKAFQGITKIFSSFKGLFGGNSENAVPVHVTNLGDSALGGFGAKTWGFLKGTTKWGKIVGRGLGIAGLGLGAYNTYEAYKEGDKKGMGENIGMMLGSAIGVLGGPIGVMLGGALGNYAGGWIGAMFDKAEKSSNYVKNQVKKMKSVHKINLRELT